MREMPAEYGVQAAAGEWAASGVWTAAGEWAAEAPGTNEEPVEIPPFDFQSFLADHWWEWALMFVLISYIFNKVFRVRKLPLLKEAIVYILIAAGSFVLLILQVDANLPILLCLLVAVALMAIVRLRYFFQERFGKKNASGVRSSDNDAESAGSKDHS